MMDGFEGIFVWAAIIPAYAVCGFANVGGGVIPIFVDAVVDYSIQHEFAVLDWVAFQGTCVVIVLKQSGTPYCLR